MPYHRVVSDVSMQLSHVCCWTKELRQFSLQLPEEIFSVQQENTWGLGMSNYMNGTESRHRSILIVWRKKPKIYVGKLSTVLNTYPWVLIQLF